MRPETWRNGLSGKTRSLTVMWNFCAIIHHAVEGTNRTILPNAALAKPETLKQLQDLRATLDSACKIAIREYERKRSQGGNTLACPGLSEKLLLNTPIRFFVYHTWIVVYWSGTLFGSLNDKFEIYAHLFRHSFFEYLLNTFVFYCLQ